MIPYEKEKNDVYKINEIYRNLSIKSQKYILSLARVAEVA